MKSPQSIPSLCISLGCCLLIAFATSSCSKKPTIDTVNLEYSFQSADSTNQAAVTQAIEAIEKGNASAALTSLQKVAADPKLTAEQKTAVSNVVQQLEKH